MTLASDYVAAKTPVHVWIVGIVSLAWNAFGCFDYYMTQTNNEGYLAAFTAEQRAYFNSFPFWMEAAWALGVWGALAGSILLLFRSRHAVAAFAISLIGLAISTFYQFVISDVDVSALMPPEASYITFAIWIIAIALLAYAWWLRGKAVLR
jgi:hypothetical protein